MAEFSESQQGKEHLIFKGFRYRRKKENLHSVNWICATKQKCKGSATTIVNPKDGAVVIERTEHSHDPDPAACEIFRARGTMKEEAVSNDTEPPRRIISDTVVNMSQEGRSRLPTQNNLKKAIRRKRNKAGALPPNPFNADLIVLPDRYKTTTDGRRFLLWDNQDDVDEMEEEDLPPRILVFATDRCLDLLKNNGHWLFDGTFKTAPDCFYQVFTVHCLYGNGAVPCVYALLPNKNQDTYASVFQIIQQSHQQPQPHSCMCDFELAAMNAFQETFPGTPITGCFFHLKQSIYRQAVDKGLRQRYIDDENIRLHIKILGSLAFVPPQDVINTFEDLVEADTFPDEVEGLYDYFENTYIGRRQRRGRRAPRFGLELWNQHNRLQEGLPRTNNLLEGWHAGIQASLLGKNPTVWRFLNFLQHEESFQQGIIDSVVAGHDSRKEKKEDKARTKRIITLVQRYPNTPRAEFLRGVSYNFNLGI